MTQYTKVEHNDIQPGDLIGARNGSAPSEQPPRKVIQLVKYNGEQFVVVEARLAAELVIFQTDTLTFWREATEPFTRDTLAGRLDEYVGESDELVDEIFRRGLDDMSPKVGDCVRIVDGGRNPQLKKYEGEIGVLLSVDDDAELFPYEVCCDIDGELRWFPKVEVVR